MADRDLRAAGDAALREVLLGLIQNTCKRAREFSSLNALRQPLEQLLARLTEVTQALLGKPITECHALVVPTAQWGHPMCGPSSVQGFLAARPRWEHLSGLGWASLGVLELTALPTMLAKWQMDAGRVPGPGRPAGGPP